jgi:hypothetical protein
VTIVGSVKGPDLEVLLPALMSEFIAVHSNPSGYLQLANGLLSHVAKSAVRKESLELLANVFEPIRLYRDPGCEAAVSGILPLLKKHIVNPDPEIALLARTSLARFSAPRPGDRR